MEQTEVDLLKLAITAKTGTQDAFAKLLDMTRQNLNRIIRQAEKNNGNLKPKFVKRLKEQYGVDIYEWKRKPTFDFHSKTELESMEEILNNVAAEPEEVYLTKKMFDHLITENTDLRNRLRECEKARAIAEKKNSRRSG